MEWRVTLIRSSSRRRAARFPYFPGSITTISMNSDMLVQVVRSRKSFGTRLIRTFICYKVAFNEQKPRVHIYKNKSLRFSRVWIERTWRLRCSERLKTLRHPSTWQGYIRTPCIGTFETRRPRERRCCGVVVAVVQPDCCCSSCSCCPSTLLNLLLGIS